MTHVRRTLDGPLPPGLIGDPDNEREALFALRGVFKDEDEQRRYMADGWERMQVVLRLLAGIHDDRLRRVLELGANPYVLTLLLQRHFSFDLELANYFGERMTVAESVHSAELSGAPLQFKFRHFNAEQDVFPYADESLDCVLFCEILEHLLLNPDHLMQQIRRVVRPGGYVIVSTPNATRLPNLYFLALGRSIWDGYSANGPYGRHNREYTLPEVHQLLDRNGFDTIRSEVRNIQPFARRFTYLQKLRPSVWYEHLFVVGRRR